MVGSWYPEYSSVDLWLVFDLVQVHGKLNTHTGAAHGIAHLKRKFFPEVRDSPLVNFVLILVITVC